MPIFRHQFFLFAPSFINLWRFVLSKGRELTSLLVTLNHLLQGKIGNIIYG